MKRQGSALNKITPGQFIELSRGCRSCRIETANGTTYLCFGDDKAETVHIETEIACSPFQTVVVEFNGKTSCIEKPEGFLWVEFFDAENAGIGSAYKGRVLGVNRCGYHRYGYIVPPGTSYGRLQVVTDPATEITLSNVRVYCLDCVPRRGRNGMMLDAHLGMLMVAPRNIMESFELAPRAGFETLITNVNASSDGVLVALHNDTVDETSDGVGKVADFSYEELQKLDFGSWFNGVYRGARIPLLESVTRFASVSGMHLIYRMHRKWADRDHDNYTNRIYHYIKKYGMVGKATLKVFNDKEIDYYREIFGNDVAYIYCTPALPTDEQIAWAASFDGDITLEPKQTVVTEEFCEKCIAAGVKMSSYIVNDVATMRRLFLMGISRFCTDTYSDIVFPLD